MQRAETGKGKVTSVSVWLRVRGKDVRCACAYPLTGRRDVPSCYGSRGGHARGGVGKREVSAFLVAGSAQTAPGLRILDLGKGHLDPPTMIWMPLVKCDSRPSRLRAGDQLSQLPMDGTSAAAVTVASGSVHPRETMVLIPPVAGIACFDRRAGLDGSVLHAARSGRESVSLVGVVLSRG